MTISLFAPSLWLVLTSVLGPMQQGPEDRPATPTGQAEPLPFVADVWKLLLPPARGKELSAEVIGSKIARLGPQAIPAVCAIYSGIEIEPDVEYEIEPSSIDLRPAILQAAIRQFAGLEVLKYVKELVATQALSLETRLTLGRLMGEVRSEAACDALFALLNGIDDAQLRREYVRVVFSESIAAIIRREPKSINRLEKLLDEGIRPPLAGPIAKGLAESKDQRVLGLMAGLLGKTEADDLAILGEIIAMAEFATVDSSANMIERLRAVRTTHDDPTVRGVAAIALATVGDLASFPDLIDLLADSEPQVAHGAAKALRRISQEPSGRDAGGWHRWLAKETAWWESDGVAALERLPEMEPAEVIAALTDLVRHPLYRHQMAPILASVLERDTPELRSAALTALQRLGSTRAVTALIEYLDGPNEELAKQVHALLCVLTERSLPKEASAWRLAFAL